MKDSRVFLLILAFLVLAVAPAEAAFVRSFQAFTLELNDDGSAEVREELRIFMDNRDSVDLYKISLRTTNDMSGWRNRLNMPDVRYHVDTSRVTVHDLRLQPLAPDTCNIEKGSCYGTFIYEYKIKAPAGDRGLVNVTKYLRPRVIGYELHVDRLLFETSVVDEEYLAERTALEIKLPVGASNIRMSPRPAEYQDGIPNDATKVTWQGRLGISQAELIFERKESLVSEVIGFFSYSQETATRWILSREGMALGVAAIILVIAYLALHRRNMSELISK